VHLALRRDARVAVVVGVRRQRDDVFADVARRAARDVILEEAGVAAGGVAFAAFLDEGGLEEDVESLAIGGGGEAFEALVVVAAGGGVFGNGFAIGVVARWGGGVEAVKEC